MANAGRDSTALTIVRVNLSQLEILRVPSYQLVISRLLTGVKHTQIFGQLVALAEAWSPRHIVYDSTGVGGGIAHTPCRGLGGSYSLLTQRLLWQSHPSRAFLPSLAPGCAAR